MASRQPETFLNESLMVATRALEEDDPLKASVALARARSLVAAKMWEAADAAEYHDLEFLEEDLVEQAQQISLAGLDAKVVAPGRVVFGEDAGEPLTAAQVLSGARASAVLRLDGREYVTKKALTKPSAPEAKSPTRVGGRSAVAPDTPPEMCCGFPVTDYVTQNGENRGRKYRKCDICGKWLGFSDGPARKNVDDDSRGIIRPARGALGMRRSGSAGKSRQIKYPGPVNRAGSEEDQPVQQQQQQQRRPPPPPEDDSPPVSEFQYASSKRPKIDAPAASSAGSNSSNSGSSNQSRPAAGGRGFNPGKSVVNAINATSEGNSGVAKRKFTGPARKGEEKKPEQKTFDDPIYEDERLKTIDPLHVENILNEVLDSGQQVTWDDIAGLEFAKNSIKEMVVWPMLRPDIFTGLRAAPKGLLLFGPPGTGKTMIGKAIAHEAKATFFAISASILTSKWIGEGEKMVRALFAVARIKQPSVIFIDEIDSLLTARSDSENEATRRIKTEFLVQLDGVGNGAEERLLLVGATNRPQELDEAARRRLTKRLYIPLPEPQARHGLVLHLLRDQQHSLTSADLERITLLSDGYSGADIKVLCAEASMGPIRDLHDILSAQKSSVRPISMDDFAKALKSVRASVAPSEISAYLEWNNIFGTVQATLN